MRRAACRSLAYILTVLLSLGPTPAAYAALNFEPREVSGIENNATHTNWGAVGVNLLRFISVDYFDDILEPRGGTGAVSPRAISNAVVAQPGDIKNARGLSDMFWQWGQFVDHDIDLTDNAVPHEPYPIVVPTGDPYFDPFNTGTQTIGFNRSVSDPATGTGASNPRQQYNQITAYIDGSNVYGSDQTRADTLRTFTGGLLKTSNGDLLPFNTSNLPNAMSTSAGFFLAGDVRANEQPGLTAMHTLFVREHNRIATQVQATNPSMTDEEVYQTARRKVGALIQAITYNEFLPAMFGADILPSYTGYNTGTDASIANEFSTAAFRLGHSMISPQVLRLGADGLEAPEGHLGLVDGFFNPNIIQASGIDSILRGMPAQVMQEVDSYEIDALRNFLFGPPGAGGFDLASLNIQRGRDHGLAPFNQARRDLGLTPYSDFSEITSNTTVASALETVYNGNIEDVDLWVGGLAENHVAGSSVGETFTAIIADQFTRLRDGDRFWYENQFSGTELDEINATRLRDIIERNTGIEGLQEFVMFAEYPEADLSVEVESSALVLSGSLITTDVTLQNIGPLTASGVTVTIAVPTNTAFASGASLANCEESGGTVTCSFDPMAASDTQSFVVAFVPEAGTCFTTVSIAATAQALQNDNDASNNTSSTETLFACPGPNDLDLQASVGSSLSVERGSSFSTMATVENNGPAFASGASLSLSIPADIEVNTLSQPNCTVVASEIICSDINLAEGTSFSVEVEFNVLESSSCPRDITLENTVSAGQQQDYFNGNNNASATTAIECEPENDVAVSLDTPRDQPISNVIYAEIQVTNNGPSIATSPVTSINLPTGVTFNSAESSTGCTQNGSTITCTLSPLGDDESSSVTVAFTPLSSLACGTEVVLQATASSSEKELNSSNNTSAELTTELTCVNSGTNTGSDANRNRDTVGNSQSPGATRGKGTSEAMMVLALLCRMNGMQNAVERTGHYRLANNASHLASVSRVAADETEIVDGFTQAERNIICGMKTYMETQDPRNRKTPEFKEWLIGKIANDLHKSRQQIADALASEAFCER